MRLLTPLILLACVGTSKSGDEIDNLLGDSDRPEWDPDPQTISNSSSSTTVAWTPPSEEESRGLEPIFYEVIVESEFGTTTQEIETEDTQLEISDLRTDTEYTIEIVACYDRSCSENTVGEVGLWRTEVEQWRIIGMSNGNFNPLIPGAHSPSLINLSNLDISQDGWILSTIVSDNGAHAIHTSNLFGVPMNNDNYDLELSSPTHSGIQDSPSSFEILSASLRLTEETNDYSMDLFVSAQFNNQSIIGSWRSNGGLTALNLALIDGEVCDVTAAYSCGMNTCLQTDPSIDEQIHNIESISVIQNDQNVDDRILIQAQSDASNPSSVSLYLAEEINSFEWSPMSLEGGLPTPLIKYASDASVQHTNSVSKLYYWDEVSGSTHLRYWDPTLAGEAHVLDLEDIEDADRVRNVYYVDRQGNNLRPSEFRVTERQFFQWNDLPMMLTTIRDSAGEKNITLGVLTNP